VASVAAPYPSRFHKGYVAWNSGRQLIEDRPVPITEATKSESGKPNPRFAQVEGNGFGCTMFRSDVFRKALFTARQQPYVDFDPAFYERLKSTGLQAKLCWDAECEHLANNEEQIMLASHWPKSWETLDLTEYRSNMLHGREACEWFVKTLNGPEPAAIWGLSDGDVAWWCYDALARELKDRMKAEGPNAPDYLRWLRFLADTSGLHDEDRDELWALFDQACRNSPHWLVQHWWEPAERFTLQALKAQGVTIDAEGFGYARSRKRKIDCNAVYRLMDHGLWWPILENKRLAIVSGQADAFTARLMDPEFVRATGGGEITWSAIAKVNCPSVHESKRQHWFRMRDQLLAANWDLLICSAGSLSALLSDFGRQIGRQALDIGALDGMVITKSRVV
jgi:hypothetical protein